MPAFGLATILQTTTPAQTTLASNPTLFYGGTAWAGVAGSVCKQFHLSGSNVEPFRSAHQTQTGRQVDAIRIASAFTRINGVLRGYQRQRTGEEDEERMERLLAFKRLGAMYRGVVLGGHWLVPLEKVEKALLSASLQYVLYVLYVYPLCLSPFGTLADCSLPSLRRG